MQTQSELAITFIDWENIVKEAEQSYDSILAFDQFVQMVENEHTKHQLRNCGIFAYSDFDTDPGVQTRLYRLGIEAKHVVTKTSKEYRSNASDIELSLDAQSLSYENPLIQHFLFISGDGDLLHVMKRLRLKGKIIHLIAFERVNKHLIELADFVTIFDHKAPFLKPITQSQRKQWAESLASNKDVSLLLYHLDKLEKEKDFVGFSYFHKVISDKFGSMKMSEALTLAKKAELLDSYYVPNPKDLKNPTSAIRVNRRNDIALGILKNE